MKSISNNSWSIKNLIERIEKKEILQPKFQRKRKWIKLPDKKNENTPNERKYIEFLYQYKNGIHPITFGKMNNSIYYNIDGNNRINAIHNFIKKPFDLFDDYLIDIYNFIEIKFPSQNSKIEMMDFF